MARYEWSDAEIKHRLEVNAMSVAMDLIPDAHAIIDKHQGLYKPRNPSRVDNNPGSFVIYTKGDSIGWHDFSGKAYPSSGDMISLIGLALGFDASSREGYPRALAWAARRFGIAEGVAERGKTRKDKPPQTASVAAAPITSKKLLGQWLGGAAKAMPDRADLLDTPIHRYLSGRDIDLPAILKSAAHRPALGSVRYHPNGRYYRGSLDNFTEHPVIANAMVGANNKITALHRTYLTHSGQKADVPSVKKVRGDPKGAAMRLWRGASGLSLSAAAKKNVRDTLIVLEGFEDGLQAVQIWPEHRVHATYSVKNFLTQPWPDCVQHMILLGDNDAGEAAARGWQEIVDYYKALAFGLSGNQTVTPITPPSGVKDLNDWWRGLTI